MHGLFEAKILRKKKFSSVSSRQDQICFQNSLTHSKCMSGKHFRKTKFWQKLPTINMFLDE